jgi:hypothetical protein
MADHFSHAHPLQAATNWFLPHRYAIHALGLFSSSPSIHVQKTGEKDLKYTLEEPNGDDIGAAHS